MRRTDNLTYFICADCLGIPGASTSWKLQSLSRDSFNFSLFLPTFILVKGVILVLNLRVFWIPWYFFSLTVTQPHSALFVVGNCGRILSTFGQREIQYRAWATNRCTCNCMCRGHAVAQLVEALRYKLEGRGFDSRWCHWNFSLIQSFRLHYGPGFDSASNRNEYQEYFLGVKAAGA